MGDSVASSDVCPKLWTEFCREMIHFKFFVTLRLPVHRCHSFTFSNQNTKIDTFQGRKAKTKCCSRGLCVFHFILHYRDEWKHQEWISLLQLHACACILYFTAMQTLSHTHEGEKCVKKSNGEQEHPRLTCSLKLPGALTMKNFLISSTVDLCSHYRIRHLSALGKWGEPLLRGR